MRDFELERELERARNLVSQSGRLIIVNSDRYSTNLQKTVEDASFIDGPSVLVAAAEQVTAKQLGEYFQKHTELSSAVSRLKSAAALFKTFGFGSIDFGKVTQYGGRVVVKESYFAKTWNAEYGRRTTSACHFTAGFIAGSLATAYGCQPGSFIVKERRCASSGARSCEFEVEVK